MPPNRLNTNLYVQLKLLKSYLYNILFQAEIYHSADLIFIGVSSIYFASNSNLILIIRLHSSISKDKYAIW